MPVFDPSDRRSYRLLPAEVEAVWGLSGELLALVEEGLACAIRSGRAVSPAHAKAEFERRQGRAKPAVLDLLGFAQARPLRAKDRALLADRLVLDEGELEVGGEPVALYELACRLEAARFGRGKFRRWLVAKTVDPQRCFALLGMASTKRPRPATLRGIVHSAWRDDAAVQARLLAARWPLAMMGGVDVPES
jgi:hypothetical protein